MSDSLPLVSIGLPVFNRPEGLKRTLECLMRQTYGNFEIIIADNCSLHPDVEIICKEYSSKDSRISYFRHEKNKGWGYNTNFVIEKAKGNYFMRATDDDWWDETFIEKIMKSMLANPKASLGFSNFIEVDPNGNKSTYHPSNHLPLLQAFTTSDRIKNNKSYISQFEGFGKSCIYFSIFKVDLLRSDFVKKTLEKEVLAGDLLINFYCLLRGDLVVVPEVLMNVSFGNEKHYEMDESKSKVLDLLFMTFDYQNFSSVRKKWIKYFFLQFSVISASPLGFFSKMKIKNSTRKRILLFYYDLICVNTRIRYFTIFEKLKRKYYLE